MINKPAVGPCYEKRVPSCNKIGCIVKHALGGGLYPFTESVNRHDHSQIVLGDEGSDCDSPMQNATFFLQKEAV